MKVGSLVYATDQGLGILAKSFYDAGVVTDVIIIKHGKHVTHDDWYPTAKKISGNIGSAPNMASMKRLCEQVDIMLFFETPFVWELVNWCKKCGTKTVLMPMFECEPENPPAMPDLYLNPSHLDQQYYTSGIHIPVPVEYKWKERERAVEFVHNSGHGGLKGRNGTAELVEAMRLVKSDARLTLRAQESSRQYWAAGKLRDANDNPTDLPSNIDLRIGTFPYEDMYATGDVFVFPEKFNGLSLPLQEARASGMLVMCGDRFPMNQWLPTEPLIKVSGYHEERVGPPYQPYQCAEFNPVDIAAKIDEWYGKDISEYSRAGKEWASTMSWEALKPKYMEVLESLL